MAGAPLSQGQVFPRFEWRGRRSTFERSGADFVAGAALSQGQVFARIELRSRRSTFERSGTDFVSGAALSQGQVQISAQAQHFRKVEYRFRGRRGTFASLGADR